ncbi:MAG: hypothetical protein ACRCZ0_02635 [Cetobacterium sp.]
MNRTEMMVVIIRFEGTELDWRLSTIRGDRTNEGLIEYALDYFKKSSVRYGKETVKEILVR